MQKTMKNSKNRGFSLIELSVSLSIIGMIAASAISVAVTSDYYTKKAETEAKLDRIEEALAGYLQSNLRLPCPASGAVANGAAGFGLEGTLTPASGGVLCPNRNFTSATGNTNVHVGVVPMRTLQLPDDYMLDGWGRRITYAVDYRFANNQTTNHNGTVTTCDGTTSTVCFVYTGTGGIAVYADNALAVSRTPGTGAVYLLLSHGENGHGAFPKNGSATTARVNAYDASNPYRTAYAAELENAEFTNAGANTASYNISYIQKDYVRVDDATAAAASREYFDDIIRFRTKDQVVKAAGKIWYDSLCLDAAAVVGTPGSNNCTGAANESNCESMATEIYSRCLQ
jgi:prepilin-type N-terminal cleavage/methylation domain-containing protein